MTASTITRPDTLARSSAHNGQPPGARQRRLRHHPWTQHRECAPEDAWTIEQNADDHPEWLPRRHPEAKGHRNSHVGVRYEAPEGAYSLIPTWLSRHRWLTVTVPVAIACHPEVLVKHGVSPLLLRRLARVKSQYAWSNGRRCIVRPDTPASVLGVSERQVQRCNAAARELGLEQVVFEGRMLNQEERFHAHDMGSRQRGLASEVALTIPVDQRGPVDHVTPPKRWVSTHLTNQSAYSLGGLTAEKKEAAPRPRPPKRSRRGHPAWSLAQQTIRAVPWLASETPHRIVGLLSRFLGAPIPWTGHTIAHALATQDRRLQRPTMHAQLIRTRPAAVLAAALQGLDPDTDHPSLAVGPLVAPPAAACGHPACDGRGWLRDLIEVAGYPRAVKCPRCTPSIRTNPRL